MYYYYLIYIIFTLFFNSFVTGDHKKDPPCFFNPLCFCSKAYPDLGRVTCKDIPLLNIPRRINTSKAFMLHLENNGLHFIEPYFLSRTGLFKIEIIRNSLKEIDEDSFIGLERSLWELNLQSNKLKKVPIHSLCHLQKLKVLDLSDNQITSLSSDDWIGLENSLRNLILKENKITNIRPKTFTHLRQLEYLDLSNNILMELDTFAFKGGTMRLSELNLSDNLLSEIPLNQISELGDLRYFDVSFNRITEVRDFTQDRNKGKSVNLLLDCLRLDYNQIQYLPTESFKHFPVINRTYLNGNPIVYIEKGAFEQTKIRELYLDDCELSDIKSDTFSGLESHLEILNVEGNNISEIPKYFFKEFKLLKSLNIKNNLIMKFKYDETFDPYKNSLQDLKINGEIESDDNIENDERLNNIRSLTIFKFPHTYLPLNDQQRFFNQLEELKISYSNVKNLKNHVFKYVRGLRRLDLSENSISTIESEAFSEVLHTLEYLSLANGLSSSVTQLPENIFKQLTSLEFLDLSNNGFKNIPQKLFYYMKRLKIIFLQDNFIEFISPRSFQENMHLELNTIQLSFNQLSRIESKTFSGLKSLENLWLNDNRIKTIEKKSFSNLYKLRHLYLRGNQISSLDDEIFQDLPELEKLDLAYNKIKSFNYGCLEQVGTLSSFTLNVSFNNIEQLTANASVFDNQNFTPEHVNIKALDLSHNNISNLKPKDLKPVEQSLTHLYLSYNKLINITKDTFGDMLYLQWLDISYNRLKYIEQDTFANTKSIQVLYFSNNLLSEIPPLLFSGFHRLRIVDLSKNKLRAIPENLFIDGTLERLDVSNNNLTIIPLDSFNGNSAKTLSELNLYSNKITNLPTPEAFAKFKNLYWLNLGKNHISKIENGEFSFLKRLCVLDLSHNVNITLDSKDQPFYGLDDTLESLFLKNLSLNTVPALHLSSLESLDLSENKIFTIPYEFPHNLTNLRRLELGNNEIMTVPPAINAFTQLEYLGISGNPLESINFQQSQTIREIDLRNAPLDAFQKGALGKISFLENLKLTINQTNEDFNVFNIIKENHGLNNLYVEIQGNTKFYITDETTEWFPYKLRNLTLVGRGLKTVPHNLLQGVRSPIFNLVIFNTSVEEIGKDVFLNAKQIRNLTLDVRSNKLETLFNPNTGDEPNVPKKIFLVDLKIKNNNWMCECAIGWIEEWERKRRQYLCEENMEDCFLVPDDLRSTVCSNRGRKPISDAFKLELECGWNFSRNLKPPFLLEFILINIFLIFYS